MPEKIIIGISVEKKIAKADENAVIVCANSNYKAVFDFDSEWADYPVKTAIFATDNTDENKPIAVVFNGNECDIPPLSNTTIVGVGVVSGDLTVDDQVDVSTTTPAYIPCLISIKDLGGVIAPPAPDVYDQIIALLNKYIEQGGGGGSGGVFDEERVREIVAEETADLQAKTDESLETESKQVVGAINELNEKKVGFTDYAMADKAGVIKGDNASAFLAYNGRPYAKSLSQEQYTAATGGVFVGKATLENIKHAYVKEGITTNTETLTSDEQLNAQKWLGVDDRFAVINTVLEQSGLVSKYKATIEDTYTERVTADGANVLDGSKAKLEKVVGSTVACKNYFDVSKVPVITDSLNITIPEVTKNGFTIVRQTGGTTSGNNSKSIFVGLKDLCPNLRAGQTVYLYIDRNFTGVNYIFLTGGLLTQSTIFELGKATTITEEMLSSNNVIWYVPQSDGTYTFSNIRVVEEQNAPWQPYFTGLKSASFAGIESTNADGTETSTLAFPKTETPLGVTIDFENKKITDYGVTAVITGEENVLFYPSYGNSAQILNCLPVEANYALGVSTDLVPSKMGASGNMFVGTGGSPKGVYMLGVLDILGFTESWVDKDNPTAEEKATAIASFKAYLAQRYADGNPVAIRYVSSVLQSETDFTADNEYTAYKGGTEKVLKNDGKDYGADNTLSQNYIIVTGVK